MDDGGTTTERPVTQVVKGEVSSDRAQRPDLASYVGELFQIFCNFPNEVRHLGRVPCAKRSLYTGILAGGLVSALALAISGTILLREILHACLGRLASLRYGFFTYLGVSIVSW